MCWPTKRFVLALLTAAAFLLLSPSICLADGGGAFLFHYMAFSLPPILALLAIALVETCVFKAALGNGGFGEIFVGVGLANLTSLIAGLPLSGPTSYGPWALDDAWRGWVVLLLTAGIVLTFLFSVYVEYRILKHYFDDSSHVRVKWLTWVANVVTYIPLSIAVIILAFR